MAVVKRSSLLELGPVSSRESEWSLRSRASREVSLCSPEERDLYPSLVGVSPSSLDTLLVSPSSSHVPPNVCPVG